MSRYYTARIIFHNTILGLPWRIVRAIALNYNLSTCYLIIVIILQGSLFLRKMVKYIQ